MSTHQSDPETIRRDSKSAFRGKTLSEVIDTFVVERGDLADPHTRVHLAEAVLVSAEVDAVVSAAENRAAGTGDELSAAERELLVEGMEAVVEAGWTGRVDLLEPAVLKILAGRQGKPTQKDAP